eukprot:CFRG7061T1
MKFTILFNTPCILIICSACMVGRSAPTGAPPSVLSSDFGVNLEYGPHDGDYAGDETHDRAFGYAAEEGCDSYIAEKEKDGSNH